MADKYKGPERRTGKPSRRSALERRYIRDLVAGRGQTGGMIPTGTEVSTHNVNMSLAPEASSPTMPHRGPGRQSIVQIKDMDAHTTRRQGPGRRKGDLSRALKTGESVQYDLSKMKSAGKLAKKAAKHIPAIGAAVGIYDLVNRAKK